MLFAVTSTKKFANDPMGYDFATYTAHVGNYIYGTTVNLTTNTVTVHTMHISEFPPF